MVGSLFISWRPEIITLKEKKKSSLNLNPDGEDITIEH